MTIKASDLFVKALENEGVEFIFGLPGEENIDLLDSISKSDIKFITTRHEQGASFMADAFGRLTQKPGVCLSTLGPGATNLLTGVANAHLDKVPLVAITGQTSRYKLHKESHQNVDTIKLFSGVTKYNQPVVVPESIPEIVRKSFELSVREVPGACHIQLPFDVAASQVDGSELMPIPEEPAPAVPEKSLKLVTELIGKSKNPIILAGNGVVRSKAWGDLLDLVNRTNIPVVSTFMAKGLVPFEHPCNLFSVGGEPYPPGMRPLHASDLVIAVGFDLVEYDPVTWNADRQRPVINIHSSPAESDEHFPVAVDLVGSISGTLRELLPVVAKREMSPIHREIREKRLEEMTDTSDPQQKLPKEVMKDLTEKLSERSVLISDVGLHKVWVSRWYHPKAAGKTLVYNGFASMGASLPASIAAKLLFPDNDVVAVSGDGGFLMNVQELETARRLELDFTVIVFNDGKFSLIEREQRKMGFEPSYISFTNPDFRLLAESFGCNYHVCSGKDGFEPALRESLSENGVSIIEINLNH